MLFVVAPRQTAHRHNYLYRARGFNRFFRLQVHTFPLLDGVLTPKLMLPARKGEQQQGALIICTENVQLGHPCLSKGDTFEIW
jgi:hypothetical protein